MGRPLRRVAAAVSDRARGTGFEKVVAIDIDDAKLRTASDDYRADMTFNAGSDGFVVQEAPES
jgi:threonine dehydrogenase-like Zn-dependent dehydrogenase